MVDIYVVFRLPLIQLEYFYYCVPGIHENMMEKSKIYQKYEVIEKNVWHI